jgi:hypothetical protein
MLMMLRFVVVQQATPALKEETNGQGQNTNVNRHLNLTHHRRPKLTHL